MHVPGPIDRLSLLQGFKRVPGTKMQTYSHQFFKRGQRELLTLMTRGGHKSNSAHLLFANFALKHKVGSCASPVRHAALIQKPASTSCMLSGYSQADNALQSHFEGADCCNKPLLTC